MVYHPPYRSHSCYFPTLHEPDRGLARWIQRIKIADSKDFKISQRATVTVMHVKIPSLWKRRNNTLELMDMEQFGSGIRR